MFAIYKYIVLLDICKIKHLTKYKLFNRLHILNLNDIVFYYIMQKNAGIK